MTDGIEGSKLLERHKSALKQISGMSVEAGWFESARYPTQNGQPGIPVAEVARIQEFGGEIEHPGGTKYIRDAIVGDRFVGTRFVKNDFPGEHEVTKPHKIIIPARPFMRHAWSNFLVRRVQLQKQLATDILSGKVTPDKALGKIALVLEGLIAKSIRDGNWTPNAPSTVAAKGFDKPLIDTSHMLQSLSSKVT